MHICHLLKIPGFPILILCLCYPLAIADKIDPIIIFPLLSTEDSLFYTISNVLAIYFRYQTRYHNNYTLPSFAVYTEERWFNSESTFFLSLLTITEDRWFDNGCYNDNDLYFIVLHLLSTEDILLISINLESTLFFISKIVFFNSILCSIYRMCLSAIYFVHRYLFLH